MAMYAILANVADGNGWAIIDILSEIGRNKLITHLINDITLNPLTAALAKNPLDGLPLRWIQWIY